MKAVPILKQRRQPRCHHKQTPVEEVLRFGLTERFEVRAVINTNTEAYTSPTIFINPAGVRGIDPVTVGFKYNLAKESDRMPQTTWLSHLSFPQVAFGDYRAVTQVNTVFHEQRLMMEKGITDRFGLATNIVAGTMSGSNGINEGCSLLQRATTWQ